MNFTEIINKRYATKDYLDGNEIKKEDLTEMLEASRLAPTALGAEQNRVIVYTSSESRKAVSKYFLGGNVGKVENASALVVFLGQKKEYLLANNAENLIANMDFFDFSKPEMKPMLEGTIGWYNSDASRQETLDLIGAGNKSSYFTIKATELGYNTTVMTGIDFDGYEKFLLDNNEIKKGERVVLAVVVGKEDPNSELNKIISAKKNRMKFEKFATFKK